MISIHAPREGRDQGEAKGLRMFGISIHAPREGRDLCGSRRRPVPLDFNPRAPRGARLEAELDMRHADEFQSTRPARGATRGIPSARRRRSYFNPRAPRGARLGYLANSIQVF